MECVREDDDEIHCGFGCDDCRDEEYCRECRAPFIRFESEEDEVAECVIECPEGFVAGEEGECVEDEGTTPICGIRCLDCEDRLFCNECEEDFVRFVFDEGTRGRCLRRCPVGYEADEDNECVEEVIEETPCPRGCAFCIDEDFCEVCEDDRFLLVADDGMTSKCVRRCPSGYEPLDTDNECVPEEEGADNCDEEVCETCSEDHE